MCTYIYIYRPETVNLESPPSPFAVSGGPEEVKEVLRLISRPEHEAASFLSGKVSGIRFFLAFYGLLRLRVQGFGLF